MSYNGHLARYFQDINFIITIIIIIETVTHRVPHHEPGENEKEHMSYYSRWPRDKSRPTLQLVASLSVRMLWTAALA